MIAMAKQGRREEKTEKGENKEYQESLDPALVRHMDSLELGKTIQVKESGKRE